MPALPVISGQECINALCEAGYHVARQKGSHVRLLHPKRGAVTVPVHKEIDRGTLRSIIRESGLSVDEFIALLG